MFRFTPSILLYLFCVVPLLWALELDEIERFRGDCGVENPGGGGVTDAVIETTEESDIRSLVGAHCTCIIDYVEIQFMK